MGQMIRRCGAPIVVSRWSLVVHNTHAGIAWLPANDQRLTTNDASQPEAF